MNLNENFKPKICDDVEIKLLYRHKNKDDVYVIASKNKDAYFYCNESILPIVKSAVELFNGLIALEDIRNELLLRFPTVNFDKLLTRLISSPLITNSNVGTSLYASEIQRTSIAVKEFDITYFKKTPKKIIKLLYWFMILLFTGAIVGFLVLAICGYIIPSNYTSMINNSNYTSGLILSILFGLFSQLFHEFAHIIVGMYNDILPYRFGFSLYMNFVPKYYVKFSGIYLANRSKRLMFHSAGVIANFILFISFTVLGIVFDNSLLYFIAFANCQLILLNLMPLSLTDGYFIMTNIIKSVNLRLDFINSITNKKKSLQNNQIHIIYAIFSLFYIFLMSWYSAFWISGIIYDYINCYLDRTMITAILSIAIILQFYITVRRKSRKM